MAMLEIEDLTVEFATHHGPLRAVDGLSLRVEAGDVVAIVGESGSGKSVAMLAVMGLLPWTAKVTAARLVFDGHDLARLGAGARRRIVGKEIAMIFQEPMTSLNPCFDVEYQIGEAIRTHVGGSRAERRRRVLALLEQVGIPDPARRLASYPHQLSGGMSQRVMIAMAIACNPRLLIADEPTTALDVTIQAQILDLLLDLQRQRGMGLVLITHDMGVVAETAARVSVHYAGQQVELQAVDDLFARPRHPYTQALLDALPERARGGRLAAIAGVVPGQFDRPAGCLFNPRCARADARCRDVSPALRDLERGRVRCHHPLGSDGPLA